MQRNRKRKADASGIDATDQRSRSKKQWLPQHQHANGERSATSINTGDAGIWATCPKGREGKCVAELRDLFEEYAKHMYGDPSPEATRADDVEASIENAVQAEIDNLKEHKSFQLFTPVRLDVQCVVFFKTIEPVEPVSLVYRICDDALKGKLRVPTRFTQRLTPMSMMGHASVESIDRIARLVLPSSFQEQPLVPRKFAIRTNMRNHNALKREEVIDQIAGLVGPSHSVDLKNYDLLILVEAYKNICGMSVVTNAFDTLKRFNMAELLQVHQDFSATNAKVEASS